MNEMVNAVPVLSRLMKVPACRVRAHAKHGIGDIGKYCIVAKLQNRTSYYIMRADIPKVLHRELTPEEEKLI